MKCYSPIEGLDIYSFSFQPIDSRMYMILNRETPGTAVMIDPCVSTEAEEMLKANKITDSTMILTHEHYDHISGVNRFRELFKSRVICNTECSEAIKRPERNKSKYFEFVFLNKPQEIQDQVREMHIGLYQCEADIVFEKEYELNYGSHSFRMMTTEGHSRASICILVDNRCLFSGDSLLRTVPVIPKPEGNRKIYTEKTLPWLLTLDKDIMVYPGHGENGKITEMYPYQDHPKKGQ